MSAFIVRMSSVFFSDKPPASKVIPLPTSARCGCSGSPRSSSTRSGRWALAAPTASRPMEAGLGERVRRDHPGAEAVSIAELHSTLGESLGGQLRRRRVDEVARGVSRVGDDLAVPDGAGVTAPHQDLLARVRLSAEAVGAHRPALGDDGLGVRRRIGGVQQARDPRTFDAVARDHGRFAQIDRVLATPAPRYRAGAGRAARDRTPPARRACRAGPRPDAGPRRPGERPTAHLRRRARPAPAVGSSRRPATGTTMASRLSSR